MKRKGDVIRFGTVLLESVTSETAKPDAVRSAFLSELCETAYEPCIEVQIVEPDYRNACYRGLDSGVAA